MQLLKANGCRVFGIDIDEARIELALASGAEDGSVPDGAREKVQTWSRGRGADACIIAAATASNDPVELAGEVSRLKGRVVAVGMCKTYGECVLPARNNVEGFAVVVRV